MSSSPNEQQIQEPEIKVQNIDLVDGKMENQEPGPCGFPLWSCSEDSDESGIGYCEKRNKKKSRKQKAKK